MVPWTHRTICSLEPWTMQACSLTQSRLTLHHPIDYSPPGSSVRGIFQARILEQVAIFSSRESSWPRIKLTSPVASALVGKFFTTEPPGKPTLSHQFRSVAQSCLTLAIPVTVALQASLSMEFSRQGYWSRLPFPSPVHRSGFCLF